MAVYADGYAKVGYFSRDDVAGRCRPLRELLVREALVGTSRMGGESAGELPPETKRIEAPDGWPSRQHLALPVGKAWMNLIEERLCQDELTRLAEDRDVANETVGFEAVLVPQGDEVVVCARDGQPVGRLGRSDVTRYAELFELLRSSESVGVCGGWVVPERDGLGAHVSIKSPKALMVGLRARAAGG